MKMDAEAVQSVMSMLWWCRRKVGSQSREACNLSFSR